MVLIRAKHYEVDEGEGDGYWWLANEVVVDFCLYAQEVVEDENLYQAVQW